MSFDASNKKRKKKGSVGADKKRKKKSNAGASSPASNSKKKRRKPSFDKVGSLESESADTSKKPKNHSRYATAHAASSKSKPRQPTNGKSNAKRKNRPKNKIKARNKAHQKAATTSNALSVSTRAKNGSTSTAPHRMSATSTNVLSTTSSGQRTRTTSNPRSFRHKFNVTEMQLVISQIGDMKKSWKTPAEEVMGRIYEIIDMEERPHLIGKYCKVMLVLDDENYRVSLMGNASEHVVAASNLKVAFETENLYILWESQQKDSRKGRSTFGGSSKRKKRGNQDDDDYVPQPPKGRPPHQDCDSDMYTIKAFETSFNETYEFRRYDFYCMACCICVGMLCCAVSAFFYLSNDQQTSVHALAAFAMLFTPVIALLIGVYVGCIWYCCTVSTGKMERYLGTNRFFGCQCKLCDCCRFQYFIVVALIGLLVIAVSISSYLLFDQFVTTSSQTDGGNVSVQLPVDEQRLFLATEVLTGVGGVGLFIFGIIVYYCCRQRKRNEDQSADSIHDQEFEV